MWDEEVATMFVCIVMEYYKNGDLDNVLKRRRVSQQPIEELVSEVFYFMYLFIYLFISCMYLCNTASYFLHRVYVLFIFYLKFFHMFTILFKV